MSNKAKSIDTSNTEHNPATEPLKPLKAAFDAAGLGVQSEPVPAQNDPTPTPADPSTDQPAEHNPADIFKDLAALRKASVVTIKRRQVLPAIRVIDKPASSLHFRVNPKADMMLDCTLVVDDEGGGKKFYFVTPAMRVHIKMSVRLRPYTLMVITTHPGGVIMLWPVPILGTGRDFPVWKSYDKAAKMAKTEWVSMVWSNDHRDYIIEPAEGEIPEPKWPERTLSEMLIEGFADHVVDNEEHPFVRKLRGLPD